MISNLELKYKTFFISSFHKLANNWRDKSIYHREKYLHIHEFIYQFYYSIKYYYLLDNIITTKRGKTTSRSIWSHLVQCVCKYAWSFTSSWPKVQQQPQCIVNKVT